MKPPVLSARWSWTDVQASATALAQGIDNTLPDELVVNAGRTAFMLECVEAIVGPIILNSWFRCDALNTAIGGSATSMHRYALAGDFTAVNVSLAVAFERIKANALPFDQLIVERTRSGAAWIHIGLNTKSPRREALQGTGATLGGPMTFTRVAVG